MHKRPRTAAHSTGRPEPAMFERTRRNLSRRWTVSGIRLRDSVLIVAALVIGLAIDVRTGFHGQALISAAIWGLLLYLLAQVDPSERIALMACLVIATAGEIFLSLVWGLYTYRLDNIPLFVPPGHVLMLMLGITLAHRISITPRPETRFAADMRSARVWESTISLCHARRTGSDLVLASAPRFTRARSSSRSIELYGTWLGNWTGAREVLLSSGYDEPARQCSAFLPSRALAQLQQ